MANIINMDDDGILPLQATSCIRVVKVAQGQIVAPTSDESNAFFFDYDNAYQLFSETISLPEFYELDQPMPTHTLQVNPLFIEETINIPESKHRPEVMFNAS